MEPVRAFDSIEAMRQLGGISKPTLYKLLKSGALRGVRCGKKWIIPASSVDEYLNQFPKEQLPVAQCGQ